MRWLSDRLSSVPTDKVLHCFAGYVISDIAFSIFAVSAYFIAIVALLIVGIIEGLKECFDLYIKKTKFDIKNIALTFVGACFNIIVNLI